ncbi:uncharacterized protein N7479_000612 [Penicillium vulpinum]|uniref:Uncharacterized protein n=1 Tax=Penicillium vulpinum TaxID=29845 RepID=A0A1V6S6B0_9EURO|nr:uncharacterized protein N7479_000612 [Penicillium vulpinum]KAJ5970694.1 hypothetical protein N7479_000612 [Penicillium vulpinum]OQE09260.1 hypothetical protein PENVUL_c007G03358 [Penicillium vulpinum]
MSIKHFLGSILNLSRKGEDSSSPSQHIEHKIPGWQPSYLRRRVLIVFVMTFCGVIATLEALNHVSQVHDRINSSVEIYRYLWTYGPTAMFTVIATFWSRVEFQVKQRAPWKSTAERSGEAREFILLDYVSETQLSSLVKSIRNKHFDVAAGVTCSMLLRLLVIFSTSLFSVQTVQAHQSSNPIQPSAIGHTMAKQHRIVMTQLSFRVLEVCLILAISLSVFMIYLGPHTTIAPWNPNPLSSIAAIMTRSNEICQSLRGTGATPVDVLHDRLKERRYYSQLTPKGFLINTEGVDHRNPDEQEHHTSFWAPYPGLIARGGIFIAIISLIAALGIVLHVSQKNDGLGTVSSNENHHYLWTIIPSVVMASIGLLFGRMDFNTRSLAPYAQLQRPAGALFEECMTVDYLDSLAITSMIRSIRTRQFAVLASTLATLITSFLVIVASGLYSPIEDLHQTSINFTQETTFYTDNLADAKFFDRIQRSSMLVTNRILHKNQAFPRWTYDELAFPELSMDTLLSSNETDNLFVDIRMPALRAAPACYFQTGSQLQWNFTNIDYGNESTYQLGVLAPSMPCSLADQDMGSTTPTPSLAVLNSQGLFGQSSMLPCGNGYNAKPATLYLWGNIQTESVTSISAMTCIEAAETVDTVTRFQLPGFNITDDNPPVPDESSVRSAPGIDSPWISWNNFNTTDAIAQNSKLDGFFTALTMGKYAIPAENLIDSNSSDMVIKAIQHQERVLKAQVFHNYSRRAAGNTPNRAPIFGNMTASNRLRLSQDAASTYVLEALLASILVLGITSSFLMNTDRVLPKNPSSIAAVASLLADSNILAQYEKVTGDPNEQSLGRAFFSRCRFFLGFQGDISDQADPWLFSEHQGCEKYCVYFSERDDETLLGNGSMWMRKGFWAKETRVEEQSV